MTDENQKVIVSWSSRNKYYYESLGYIYTKMHDKFEVIMKELLPSSSAKIVGVCDKCGAEFEAKYSNYYRAKYIRNQNFCCSKCKDSKNSSKKNERYYNEIVPKFRAQNCSVISTKDEFTNTSSMLSFSCEIHGKFNKSLKASLNAPGCPKCLHIKDLTIRYANNLFDRQENHYNKCLEKANSLGYTLVSSKEEIINNSSYIEYICPKHGIKKSRVNNFITKTLCCKECVLEQASLRNRMSLDDVIKRIETCGGHVVNPEDYINSEIKNLYINCPMCGNPYLTSFKLFTQRNIGSLCEECQSRESSGERFIRMYLEKNNIQFSQYYWFSDCRDVNPLPFDFYLPNNNTIIEFDGEQHFTDKSYKSNHFHDSLEYTQLHDKIKNEYCKNKNINLIRIPYWDILNIDTILDKKLLHKDIV